MGYGKGSPKREVHSHPRLSQELEKSQMHKLTLHLKDLEKEQQIRPKPSRRREIMKIRAEINEKETRKTVEDINETRRQFFERTEKIDKPLARLTQRKRERTEINKIMNEKEEIVTNMKEIETVTSNYYQQLYDSKLAIWKKWMFSWKLKNCQD